MLYPALSLTIYVHSTKPPTEAASTPAAKSSSCSSSKHLETLFVRPSSGAPPRASDARSALPRCSHPTCSQCRTDHFGQPLSDDLLHCLLHRDVVLNGHLPLTALAKQLRSVSVETRSHTCFKPSPLHGGLLAISKQVFDSVGVFLQLPFPCKLLRMRNLSTASAQRHLSTTSGSSAPSPRTSSSGGRTPHSEF